MSAKDRYEGGAGKRLLADDLLRQCLVESDQMLANAFMKAVKIKRFRKGSTLIKQNSRGTDLYFILCGSFNTLKNRRVCNVRAAGQHVGEMNLLDSREKRSATLVAAEDSWVAEIGEPAFSKIADNFPEVWRRMAHELAARLRSITPKVRERNVKPKVFIGSSSESRGLAEAVKVCLSSKSTKVDIWGEDVFEPSETALDSLIKVAKTYDFAVFVFGRDDKVISRLKRSWSPRDNVVLEVGLFMGAIGRKRTFIICPDDFKLKIPSDLDGFTLLTFESDTRLSAEQRVKRAAESIRKRVQAMKSR